MEKKTNKYSIAVIYMVRMAEPVKLAYLAEFNNCHQFNVPLLG